MGQSKEKRPREAGQGMRGSEWVSFNSRRTPPPPPPRGWGWGYVVQGILHEGPHAGPGFRPLSCFSRAFFRFLWLSTFLAICPALLCDPLTWNAGPYLRVAHLRDCNHSNVCACVSASTSARQFSAAPWGGFDTSLCVCCWAPIPPPFPVPRRV